MPRPIWKGFITFGLVNIPVVLYSAEKKSEIQFHMVDKRDRSRIRYERVNETTGKEVAWENVAKGYEHDSDVIVLDEKVMKKIAGENSKTIDIENFVEKDHVNSMYFEKPYYLVPEKKGLKGYVILREVLKTTKKAGIAKVIIHTKEYLAMVTALDDALVLNILRYQSELRSVHEFEFPGKNIKAHKITAREIEIAKKLVQSMSSKWKPKDYQDEYKLALSKWIKESIKTHHPHTTMKKRSTASLKPEKVVDFVGLLKKSLQDKKFVQKPRAKHKKQTA